MADINFPKIRAIVAVRRTTDATLKEAKDAVEEAMLRSDDFSTVVQMASRQFNATASLEELIFTDPPVKPNYQAMWEEACALFEQQPWVKEELDRIAAKYNH